LVDRGSNLPNGEVANHYKDERSLLLHLLVRPPSSSKNTKVSYYNSFAQRFYRKLETEKEQGLYRHLPLFSNQAPAPELTQAQDISNSATQQ